MNRSDRLERFTLPLTIGRTRVDIAGLHRDGAGPPLVFLHGFGSTKEDYADVVHQAALADRSILAYDAPGCGASTCSDLAALSIPFLVSAAERTLRARGIARYHLIGHSMGGLTALMLAVRNPGAVAGFVNIEGNLAPEDCFLSRQVVSHAHDDPAEFLARFADRVAGSRYYASGLFAASLPHKVRAAAVKPIFASMIDLSDHGNLLELFLGLPAAKMFLYGRQNAGLSYLSTLAGAGVQLAEIADSAHFPMYSNPPAMWSSITGFITRADAR